ncbi:excinuclease ABC subunit UvrC [Verrucomicrobiaceae bacterium 5K15]|uniref:Excinuclease ABC subunit UvrC n=1 Tax=Oceaniferula flava TaxID=2800421 RepID=A0AAE2SDL1_9BACT|nr:excinuclease ABC subunit UvrC [Oceaniferula flavus]MBK1856291.1 excinuclease ABC subunit UvrC [Oceaniferula flavus]MBM1137598.1 excinuclease ABC subunit UvrC [Oceaniferula flavus]
MSTPEVRKKLQETPHKPGVYLMKDRLGGIIYVGKARDLKKRVGSYFMPSRKMRADLKTRALIDSICDFDLQIVRNEQEALILESKLIKEYRPRYNVSLRDDKRFYMVKLQLDDPLPRFMLTRLKKDDGARYFGPFVHSTALKATLEWINREFGLRTCRPRHPGENDYRHCHADIIRKCSAPCIGKVSEEQYRANVMEAVSLLEGKGRRERLQGLRDDMAKAAEKLQFEKAARLRDIIGNLEKTLSPARSFSRGRGGVPSTVNPSEDLAELQDALGLPDQLEIMECFDISNVSSNHIVASMVRFVNGAPDNQGYRRYRIKTVQGQDDFASMAEVVRRRYSRILTENNVEGSEDSQESPLEALRRLAREGKSPLHLPNLVIVDGGKGQLGMAVKELNRLGLHDLPVIGLAKQHEEIFRPGNSEPLLLPHDTGALKLLQRIRDEAHRFANNYNELLLRRRVRESLLDDCPGMSPKRKEALLRRFGSVKSIRKASVKELESVPGIGKKTAEQMREFLDKG